MSKGITSTRPTNSSLTTTLFPTQTTNSSNTTIRPVSLHDSLSSMVITSMDSEKFRSTTGPLLAKMTRSLQRSTMMIETTTKYNGNLLK